MCGKIKESGLIDIILLIFSTILDFPSGSESKQSASNARDQGSVPGSGRFPGEGHGNPLQYPCLENSMHWATNTFKNSGIWGQYPVLSIQRPLRMQPWGGCSPLVSILSSLRAHHGGRGSCSGLSLQHPLFTDKAGNFFNPHVHVSTPRFSNWAGPEGAFLGQTLPPYPLDCSTPGFPILHYLPEFAQTHVHWVGDAIQPSHLCCPLFSLPSIFPSNRVFSKQLALCIRWPKYWSFNFSISPSNEYSGVISFRIDWFDFLSVQGTLKNLFQHHNSKPSALWCQSSLWFNSHICT